MSLGKTRALIDQYGLEPAFVKPARNEDIQACARAIGFQLPQSYCVFLTTFGFGGVESIEFLGLFRGDLYKESHANAFLTTQAAHGNADLPRDYFVIETFDGDAFACLLLSSTDGLECPVVLWDLSENSEQQALKPHIIANSFDQYFHRKLLDLVEDDQLSPID